MYSGTNERVIPITMAPFAGSSSSTPAAVEQKKTTTT